MPLNPQATIRRINSAFAPFFGSADLPGRSIYVDIASGVDAGRDGLNPNLPLLTIAEAIDQAVDYDKIFISPGDYSESVVIPRTLQYVSIVGLGPIGSVKITAAAANETGLTNEADDIVLQNLRLVGNGTGSGLINRGSRLRAYACTMGDAGATGVTVSEGTAAQVTALTHGTGTNPEFYNCIFTNVAALFHILASDQGSILDIRLFNCYFNDPTTTALSEAGGTASTRFRNLLLNSCIFGLEADGTNPATGYVVLNGDNANSGMITNCRFPTDVGTGLNLISSGIAWVGNSHPSGIATTVPGAVASASVNSKLGTRVLRPAADILNGTATPGVPIYTVSGGRVLLTHLEMEVTVANVDATPSATKITFNPTIGADIDLCATNDVNADILGSIYTIAGVLATALQGGVAGAVVGATVPIVLPEGAIGLTSAADAGVGGALIKCELWYIPLDDGASVVAA